LERHPARYDRRSRRSRLARGGARKKGPAADRNPIQIAGEKSTKSQGPASAQTQTSSQGSQKSCSQSPQPETSSPEGRGQKGRSSEKNSQPAESSAQGRSQGEKQTRPRPFEAQAKELSPVPDAKFFVFDLVPPPGRLARQLLRNLIFLGQ
jgi:hypothetical protein